MGFDLLFNNGFHFFIRKSLVVIHTAIRRGGVFSTKHGAFTSYYPSNIYKGILLDNSLKNIATYRSVILFHTKCVTIGGANRHIKLSSAHSEGLNNREYSINCFCHFYNFEGSLKNRKKTKYQRRNVIILEKINTPMCFIGKYCSLSENIVKNSMFLPSKNYYFQINTF